MESLRVEYEGNNYEVHVAHRRVRSVTLRVMKDGTARMTVPRGFTDYEARALLAERAAWLSKSVEESKALAGRTGPYVSLACLPERVEYMGNSLALRVGYAKRAYVEEAGPELLLASPRPESSERSLALLDAWYKAKALEKAAEYMEEFLAAMDAPPKGRPSLRARAMSSRWGSYSFRTNTICVNTALVKAVPGLFRYVVLHELAHTFHQDHQSGFKRFMDAHMPDWRGTRQELGRWARGQGPSLERS